MKKYSKEELLVMLDENSDVEKISFALLYIAFNENEVEWVEDRCLHLISHPNVDVGGLAITCLGHLARIHSKINKKKVIPLLVNKLKSGDLSGRVEDALEDIEMFAKD